MKKYTIIFITLFVLIISCSKSDNSSNENHQKLLLSKIESIIKNNTLEVSDTFDFIYDSENNLVQYEYESSNMLNYTKSLLYSNGQLIELGDLSVTVDNNIITLTSNNRKQEYFSENDKIVKYKWYNFDENSSTYNLDITTELTFDNDFENVIKSEQFDSNGNLIQFSNFEYDNKNNPFLNFSSVFNLSEHIFLNPFNSKNNITRRMDYEKSTNFQTASIATYSYTYNNLNYPVNLDYTYKNFNLKRDYTYN